MTGAFHPVAIVIKKQFDNINKLIFDKDKNAKVIFYSGYKHVSEISYLDEEWNEFGKNFIPLGYYINEYTKGKNLSISINNIAGRPDICILRNKIYTFE